MNRTLYKKGTLNRASRSVNVLKNEPPVDFVSRGFCAFFAHIYTYLLSSISLIVLMDFDKPNLMAGVLLSFPGSTKL